jgi:hypothetical protein
MISFSASAVSIQVRPELPDRTFAKVEQEVHRHI